MFYEWLKVCHVLSAVVIVGGSVASQCAQSAVERSGVLPVIKKTVSFNHVFLWCVVVPSVFFQMLSGFILIGVKGLPIQSPWLWGIVVTYLFFLGVGLWALHAEGRCYAALSFIDDEGSSWASYQCWRTRQKKRLHMLWPLLVVLVFLMSNLERHFSHYF